MQNLFACVMLVHELILQECPFVQRRLAEYRLQWKEPERPSALVFCVTACKWVQADSEYIIVDGMDLFTAIKWALNHRFSLASHLIPLLSHLSSLAALMSSPLPLIWLVCWWISNHSEDATLSFLNSVIARLFFSSHFVVRVTIIHCRFENVSI